ncbi:hypothetical protein SAMN04488128_101221 [Chitinophaga eiseniae]|uniref:Uncharacterized protein n=1 Tax=Chitinophaga eiseniae TaxID=634771 RepID=A0A1T4KN68_9BACT|nr:hypothetical protein [Chitinophaga eiseniae]SJZ43841.1 hypothetical protein SAMN04488128_101221 [Chitinophaga eiseniae]
MEDITHSYRIVAANVINSSLVEKGSQFEHGHVLGYGIEQDQKLDNERKLIVYTTSVIIVKKETDERLFDFKTICFFELKDFDQHVTSLQERAYNITPIVRDSMSKIAVGITRGLMCAQLKDTYISNAMLPLLPFEF